jgi:hypothetical protein
LTVGFSHPRRYLSLKRHNISDLIVLQLESNELSALLIRPLFFVGEDGLNYALPLLGHFQHHHHHHRRRRLHLPNPKIL